MDISAVAFLAVLAAGLFVLFAWGFRALPAERWQFVASAAVRPAGDGGWTGLNFTYYGLFSAIAYTAAGALYLLLMASLGAPLWGAGLLLAALLPVCAAASRWLVWLIERKRHGFTVGGASFVGFAAAPLLVAAADRWAPQILAFEAPVAPTLAAFALAYALGESVGRLACISFGCCYGKPVAETSGWVRRLSERAPFVFTGKTKKIAFASALDGAPVVPVQAFTATVLAAVALVGLALFFAGWYRTAFAFVVCASQAWRAYSETMRADYRGEGRWSVYQRGAAALVVLGPALAWLLPGSAARPDLPAGLDALATAGALLALQALFLAAFWLMGRSTQTGARLSFHVHAERI